MIYSQLKNSYVGNKGYTIYKNEITKEELEYLKGELIAKPFTNGMIKSTQDTFPIYRESEKKIYVPRYFGEKIYGRLPIQILDGEDISLVFDGDLRDYQQKVVDAYKINIIRQNDFGGGLIEIGCGRGKTVCALKLIAEMKKKNIGNCS